MKEKDEENEKLIDNSQEQYLIEKVKNEDIGFKKPNNIKGGLEFDTGRMTSFELELLNAVKKEEEEEFRKKILKERKKIKKKLILSISKDYLFFFILLMSSVFNFSYLYLVNIIIATIYIFYIEKLSLKAKKVKYLCEIFSLGYSSYVLIFKLIMLILIGNNKKKFSNSENFLKDLGIYILKDEDKESNYCFIMTFLTEIFVIVISGYSTFITFYCRTLEENTIKLKEIKMLTLRKTILLSYFFIVLYGLFNISFLSLLYIIYIQFILLLHSINIAEKQIKSFYSCVIYFLVISSHIQIVFTNILNIPSLKDNILNKKNIPNSDKKYSIFTQIGIKNSYDDTGDNIALSFFSYFLGVLLLVILLFIHMLLKTDNNIKSEEEVARIKTLKNMQEMSIIENKDENNNNDNAIEVKKGNIITDNSKLKNKPIIKEDKEKTEKDKIVKKKKFII